MDDQLRLPIHPLPHCAAAPRTIAPITPEEEPELQLPVRDDYFARTARDRAIDACLHGMVAAIGITALILVVTATLQDWQL